MKAQSTIRSRSTAERTHSQSRTAAKPQMEEKMIISTTCRVVSAERVFFSEGYCSESSRVIADWRWPSLLAGPWAEPTWGSCDGGAMIEMLVDQGNVGTS